MATAKKTTAPAEAEVEEIQVEEPVVINPYEKVACKLPRIPGRDDPVYVSVNDYSATIPRGKTVMIPRYVKEEVDRAEAALDAQLRRVEDLLEQSK